VTWWQLTSSPGLRRKEIARTLLKGRGLFPRDSHSAGQE
jgi:hypothetical protein